MPFGGAVRAFRGAFPPLPMSTSGPGCGALEIDRVATSRGQLQTVDVLACVLVLHVTM